MTKRKTARARQHTLTLHDLFLGGVGDLLHGPGGAFATDADREAVYWAVRDELVERHGEDMAAHRQYERGQRRQMDSKLGRDTYRVRPRAFTYREGRLEQA